MPGKTLAIVQSNYVPWRGYFDLIRSVDEFILLDDVQYTRRDWRNRNRIKTPQGPKWLTIPVMVKGRYHQRIDETMIEDADWAKTHWRTIQHNYRSAAGYDEFGPEVERLYRSVGSDRLSEVNRRFLEEICSWLGIETKVTSSADYGGDGAKGELILDLCLKAEASRYVSGPAARDYMDVERFEEAGVEVEWFDYAGYREYPQVHPPFVAEVSILDLMLNTGRDAVDYLDRNGPSDG